MMAKKIVTVVICLWLNTLLPNEIKFGEVPKEEVEAKEHALEKDARAAILYKKETANYGYNSDNGWSVTRSVHLRIKIYSKKGFDWATLQIPLYIANSEKERTSGIKGFTFNSVEGKIVRKKLDKDGIFEENVNKNRNKVSITMPDVKEGSVLDIQYKVVSPIYWHMDAYQFQYDIPVNKVEMKLNIPEYFIFKRYSKGFYPIQLNQSVSNRKINVQWRSSDQTGYVGRSTHRSGSIDFKENVFEVSATDLPSMVEEDYTDNINNYRTAIKFELASTQFPNSPYKNYSQSWEDVAKSIYEYDAFGAELKKTNYFEDDLNALLQGVTDKNEKIAKIFGYVKAKMIWNKYTGVGCSDGVRKAYKEGTGNVAEINLMLTSMLRYAGINANPVLTSTKSHGIPLFPTREGFNYVISAVEILDGVILLDATDKNAYFNILPERVLNWEGRLIRKEGSSSQISLVPKKISKKLFFISASIADDGSVNGKMRTQYMDQYALLHRNKYKSMENEAYLEGMENYYDGIEISEHKIENNAILSKPITETCSFFKENQCEIVGNKMYFSPMLFLATSENPFKLDKREYPVDFVFPQQERYMVNINIPEGYVIENAPKGAVVQIPNGMGTFKYNIKTTENQIQLIVVSDINQALIPSVYYNVLKEYYGQLVLKETEKIVLAKS